VSGWSEVSWLCVGVAAAAGLLVCQLDLLLTSAVLHRGLAHRALTFPRGLERAVCVWAWLSEFARPLAWIATHRHHHAHADTPDDPHAPGIRGAWKVTLLTWRYATAWADANPRLAAARYLGEFRDERLLRFLDRRDVASVSFYGQVVLGVLYPVALGFLIGRVVPYMLSIGYMNAAGHRLGSRRHDNLGTDARGLWQTLAAFWLAGEPLGHNHHHRFPGGASFRPGRLEPGHWFATRVLRGVARAPSGAASSTAPLGAAVTSG
jgi:stearoyl-CoA desaturase (Delta-9 desaturase)